MGSGYRVFTAGEVLTASNVQDYLMDQSVMSFADSTARATSIGTANFEEGMLSYLQDTNQLEVYDGASWASIAPTTTQGLTLINTTSFSAVASQSINDVFSATYDNYKIIIEGPASTGTTLNMRYRVGGADDSTSNYNFQRLGASSTIVNGAKSSTQTSQSIGLPGGSRNSTNVEIYSPFLTATTNFQSSNYSDGHQNLQLFYGIFTATTSFTGFTLIPASGTITGTVSVYGYNK
jgi:hypothetical protein